MTERLRRAMAVWNWLPAVRVVAEHESIQRAARELAVSPSALSRTIKLAEDAVGAPLFVRNAAGISVTEAGWRLLAPIRTAMRAVDDGLEALTPLPTGRFVAAYAGPIAERALAVAAAKVLRDREAPRRLVLRRVEAARAPAELLRGEIDFVLSDEAVVSAEVTSTLVVDLPFGWFAPPGTHFPAEAGGHDAPPSVDATFTSDGLFGVESVAVATSSLAELPIAVASAGFSFVAPSARKATLHALRRHVLDERADLGAELVAHVRALG